MKLENNWQNKSIEALENRNYGDLATAPTPLVQKCFQYVKLPVGTLTVEQLRLLIGQEISLLYLVPLALDILEKNILAEGDYYPGDLLAKIVKINAFFWKNNPELYERFDDLLINNKQIIEETGISITGRYLKKDDNEKINIDGQGLSSSDLAAKVMDSVNKALRKLVETSAANNESLVVGDKKGGFKSVPAKELLKTLPKK